MSRYESYTKHAVPGRIEAGGRLIKIEGEGTMLIQVKDSHGITATLKPGEALYLPEHHTNVISNRSIARCPPKLWTLTRCGTRETLLWIFDCAQC